MKSRLFNPGFFLALALPALVAGCQVTGQQATMTAKAVIAGNAAGASIAGIVSPAYAIPAAAGAAIGDTLTCAIAGIFSGGCGP